MFFWSTFAIAQNDVATIEAEGNQAYCPTTEIPVVTDFNIFDPNNNSISEFYIQISEGYERGTDNLKLSNPSSHPNIIATPFDVQQGKFGLFPKTGDSMDYDELIAAVKDVVYWNTQVDVQGERVFSLTLGSANYLPSTGHYYKFIPSIGITWQAARVEAESLNYYGLQGYLATILSQDEAVLSGEQAEGAGWIGGSDAEVEGVWRWVTGPESLTADNIFWNGGINGSTPAGKFAFWNTNEPNNLGDEDYAHVTAPGVGVPGSWNDLSNVGSAEGDYQPKGFIVEYGGMPGDPELDLSESTRIYIPKITDSSGSERCGDGVLNLTASASSGEVYWFESLESATPIHTGDNYSPDLSASKTYYVLASEDADCHAGIRTEVFAVVHPNPDINDIVALKNCDEDGNTDGFTDFNLNQANALIFIPSGGGDDPPAFGYYLSRSDAENDVNEIPPSPFNNRTSSVVYCRVESNQGCFRISQVNLSVSAPSPIEPGYFYSLITCDTDNKNDGFFSFNLSEATQPILDQAPSGQDLRVKYYVNAEDAQLEMNELPQENFVNTIAFEQSIFVRIESADNADCIGIGEYLKLVVNPLPEFKVKQEFILCLNIGSILVETFDPQGDYIYQWFNDQGTLIGSGPTIDLSSPGNYTVIATSDQNCKSKVRNFVVKESDRPNLTANDIQVEDNRNNNTITVLTANLGVGDYRFALDNGPFQVENIFEFVEAGLHIVRVRDRNGCGEANIEVSVIGFPKFFTPNNDGFNDFWQVEGIEFQPNSTINIFDRFGKLLFILNGDQKGWDGSYQGIEMPSTDYWYVGNLEDGRVVKGHFSLIRSEKR